MSDDDDDEWLKKFLEEEERLLTKGDEMQKLSVIGSLPELLRYDQRGTVSKIIPKIQQELPKSSSEFNLAVSRMFNILMHMEIPVDLVPQILQGIDNKDPMIGNAWMETLLSVIPLLPENVIKNNILQCAVSKSQLSKPVNFRVSSCKILGKISVHKNINPFDVKKDVLPLVQSLCQDCYHEVRAAMCKELPCVAQGLFHLGDAIVKVNLLPLLVELSSDENVYVRSAAIEAVVNIIPFLSSDTIKATIIPLTKRLCSRSAVDGDGTYITIARVFGTLIINLQKHMSSSEANWFLDYFGHICSKGLSLVEELETDPSVCMMCRENCASCLPTMAMMVLSLIPMEITSKWYFIFRALGADTCYIVRKAVAGCFSDILNILGPSNKIVVPDFVKLLRDDDDEVLLALVPHLAAILEQFVATHVLQRETPVQGNLDIGRALLKSQTQAFRTHNWRMKEGLLSQWERLPNCFPSDFIHQHFTPVVLQAAISGKAKPVRSQACRTLLVIMKYSQKEIHRKWIRDQVLTQLCYSSCCYSRQMYITLCSHALDIFSWRYFKDYFYLPLLGLADDQISIVRLSMVKLVPILKQMLTLPADRALQVKLESIMTKMEMMESDKDVIMLLRKKLKEMRSSRTMKVDVLTEDKRRAEEEEKIIKGKWTGMRIPPNSMPGSSPTKDSTHYVAKPDVSDKPTSKTPSQGTLRSTKSPMPFLDQHFYTDAGISLPQDFDHFSQDRDVKSSLKTSTEVTKLIESAENLTSWLDEISITDNEKTSYQDNSCIKLEEKDMVISVENVNPVETLTENDVKALETTTTNMTDELKANIQSISEFNNHKLKSKRNSCVFSREIKPSQLDKSLKRRSLNIPNSESKIPVSRSNRLSLHEKSKSVSDQALDVSLKAGGKRMSRISRLTRSAVNLRENRTDIAKSLQKSRSGSYEALENASSSRIPFLASNVTDNTKKIVQRKSLVLDNTEKIGNKPMSFKRFSASESTLKYSIRESIKNNNAESSSGELVSQVDYSDYSNELTNEVLVTNKEKNSGLPLSVRRKAP